MDTEKKKTAGVCQLVGLCPFHFHSQYACHILAKQYISEVGLYMFDVM